MARRKLSRQQQKRIRAAQDAQALSTEHRQGRVISHQGGRVLVEFDAEEQIEARIKSNLGNIVCGDRVAIETTPGQAQRVVAVLPRDNLLQRIDGFDQVRAVAANITQLVVCLAIRPPPNLLLLDQYLVSAEQQGIEAVILLNKIDLFDDGEDPFDLGRIYRPLGYALIHTSVTTGDGMLEFRRILEHQISVLGGVSGVGKSSLTQWLLPDEEIKIASISEATDEGRHTTRASRLYHLPGGGELIDTPGVRGFTPFVDREQSPGLGFREIREFAEGCRFHNCQHLQEPGCAVRAAVEAADIAPSRYQSYLRTLGQEPVDRGGSS